MAAKSPLRKTDESEPCPLIRPLRGHLTLSPLAFGHLPLIRGVGPQGEGFWAAQCAAPTEEGKAFGRLSVPPLRRKGRFSGGEDTAPTEKKKALEHIGRPFRGTKMGGFSNHARGARSPCA